MGQIEEEHKEIHHQLDESVAALIDEIPEESPAQLVVLSGETKSNT